MNRGKGEWLLPNHPISFFENPIKIELPGMTCEQISVKAKNGDAMEMNPTEGKIGVKILRSPRKY